MLNIKPKKLDFKDGFCDFSKFRIIYDGANSIIENCLTKFNGSLSNDSNVYLKISYKDNDCSDVSFNAFQGYYLKIDEYGAEIVGESAQGAYYGLLTFSELTEDSPIIRCCEITDYPDMLHRGFYLDVSRGNIPKVSKIKEFITELAQFRINSIQLYIEHTFEFEGMEDINKEYGFYTADEIKEIVSFCDIHFIDCIPSIATFGHMYLILQNEKFKHLCEIENYVPTTHIWHERMLHHTINYKNPESFSFVCSLIDQYSRCFHSKYFNICCDETFDLASYRNKGDDKKKAYLEFVKKIICYIKQKNMIPMMWGDIIWQYPSSIKDIPNDTILLNWHYSKNVKEESFKYYADNNLKQIVCPSTATWNRVCECADVNTVNIAKMIDVGYKYHSLGVLNTFWGDHGHVATLRCTTFGALLGGAKSWNVTDFDLAEFSETVSKKIYKYDGNIIDILLKIEPYISIWRLIYDYRENIINKVPISKIQYPVDYEDFSNKLTEISECIEILENSKMDDDYKLDLLNAAKLNYLCLSMILDRYNNKIIDGKTKNQIICVFNDYKEKYLTQSKQAEIKILEEYIKSLIDLF